MWSNELVWTDSLNIFQLIKETLYFLNLHTMFLAVLYFPPHFEIYPAKIFVTCSVCVHVCLNKCYYTKYIQLGMTYSQRDRLEKSLCQWLTVALRPGIMGDQWGLSHLLSLTLEFTLPVFFHMPLNWMLTVSFNSQLYYQNRRLIFKDVLLCNKAVSDKERYLMLNVSK